MSNKSSIKVPLNRERFFEVLKFRKCSIRELGKAYDQIDRTEKTIRRCVKAGEISPDLLDRIAKYLNIHPDYLSGVYDEQAEKCHIESLRHRLKSKIKPENYPYFLKVRSDLHYVKYFDDILTMNDISKEQFRELPPEERVLIRQEMNVAILQVLAKHFKKNSLGKDIMEELSFCESMVGDDDPFSYYAELEGIGLSEDNLFKDQ